MKKLCLVILSFILLLTAHAALAAESKTADRSNIRAFIDNTPIESYIVNDYTYIPADLLSNYGFDVVYDDASRTLNITRIRYATPNFTKEMWEDSVAEKTSAPIINSDIKILLDGNEANSICIDKGALLMFDELQKYGEVKWGKLARTITVSIFKSELQKDFDNADGVVEIDYEDKNAHYIGQVNEHNQPHGIGLYEHKYDLDKMKSLGYFINGKPDGYIYRETYRTVSHSYSVRWTEFIGRVDGGREVEIEEYTYDGMTLKRQISPNLGVVYFPIKPIDNWTSPEAPSDKNVYTDGCYYEHGYQKNDNYEYRTWKTADKPQTVVHRMIDEFPGKKVGQASNDKITALENCYRYTNDVISYRMGAVLTESAPQNDSSLYILNSPDDGGGLYPLETMVLIDNKAVAVSPKPLVINDRLMLPCRSIFKKLGAEVSWEDETKTVIVTKGNKTILLQIGSNTMSVDGEYVEIDTAPLIKYDYTYIPLRAAAEALGARVRWDDNLKCVFINTSE